MDVARRLALGRLLSRSGGSAAFIALVAAIYGQTDALWMSAAIFSSVVASLASAPGAGWIGDRFDRRRVLIGSDVAAAAVSLAMAATADRRGGACRPARGLVYRAIPVRAGVGCGATDRRAQEGCPAGKRADRGNQFGRLPARGRRSRRRRLTGHAVRRRCGNVHLLGRAGDPDRPTVRTRSNRPASRRVGRSAADRSRAWVADAGARRDGLARRPRDRGRGLLPPVAQPRRWHRRIRRDDGAARRRRTAGRGARRPRCPIRTGPRPRRRICHQRCRPGARRRRPNPGDRPRRHDARRRGPGAR